MIKKTFVSIFFLKDKLQILQLNSGKNKVIKHALIDLPDGLIKNHKVVDVGSLSKILKNTWSKLHIRESSVGIVVPEFSTFTKLFTIPKLSTREINEAVRFQVQDYIPTNLEEMVMDWKIADKAEGEILTVAINEKVLAGYVESAEKAGLFPSVVETPSLSLSRLSKDSSGKLIFFNNLGEKILLLVKGRKILGSSVITSEKLDEVIKIAKQIISRYKSVVKPEKLLVCGSGIDETTLQTLSKELGVGYEDIKINIKGLNEQEVREYLIPILLQFKESEEPADPNTINLLPVALVEKYKSAKSRLQVWSLTLTVTLFVWISFFSALGTYLFINQMASDLREANAAKRQVSRLRNEAIAQVKEINEVANRVEKIKAIYVNPQHILNSINSAKPQGIKVVKYDLDLDKGDIKFEGIAATRQSLIEFKQNLEKNSDFSAVSIPVSSFEKEIDIDFKVSLKYLPVVNTTIVPRGK